MNKPHEPAAGDYRPRMTDLLQGRAPLEVLRATPIELGRLVAETPPQRFRCRPYPGKWRPVEILGHLVDAEWVLGYRSRMILCQDKPHIQAMDQELWVSGQRYVDIEPAVLTEHFRALRGANLSLWDRLGQDELARHGEHQERGLESLEQMLAMYAGHDLSHLDQLGRYLAAADLPARGA